jgi:cell division protein FtsL
MTCQKEITAVAVMLGSVVLLLLTGCVSTTTKIIDTTNPKRQFTQESWALTFAEDKKENVSEQ